MRLGSVLTEAAIVYAILALALATLAPLFVLCLKAGKHIEPIMLATLLSEELLEEIRIRKWDESTTSPPRGNIQRLAGSPQSGGWNLP